MSDQHFNFDCLPDYSSDCDLDDGDIKVLTTPLSSMSKTPNLEEINTSNNVYKLLEEGKYLLEYPSWLAFKGESNRSKFSNHYVSRNDKIWELLATEHNFLSLLTMIRNVYEAPLSAVCKSCFDSHSRFAVQYNLFPNMDELIRCHAQLFASFLKSHNSNPDHVIEHLGECFVKTFTQDVLNTLEDLYSQIMYVQSSLKERMLEMKKSSSISDLITKCERDPRTQRRTIMDCYLLLVQRWTKTETLISSIITDTVAINGTEELDNLHTALHSVQTMLINAQTLMMDMVNAETLHNFVENFDLSMDSADSRQVLERLQSAKTKLINYDKLHLSTKKETKTIYVEVYGIALTDCFFLLQENKETGKFSFYSNSKMPSIIFWSDHLGYFREVAGLPLSFHILLQKPVPFLIKFKCTTHDEYARWQKVFSEGFAKYGKQFKPLYDDLVTSSKEKRAHIGELMSSLRLMDEALIADWRARNDTFAMFFGTDKSKTPSIKRSLSSTDKPTLSINANNLSCQLLDSPESHLKCQQKAKFCVEELISALSILQSMVIDPHAVNLSRSVSDAVNHKGTVNLQKNETFDNFDSVKKKKDKVFQSNTIKGDKKNKSRERLSTFLRPSSRAKHDNSRKGDSNFGFDLSEQKSFSSASKDDVSVFHTPDESTANSDSSIYQAPSINTVNILTSISELVESLSTIVIMQSQNVAKCNSELIQLRGETESFANLSKSFKNSQNDNEHTSTLSLYQERESLRQLTKKFEEDKKKWTQFAQKRDAEAEKSNQKIIDAKNKLAEDQRKYEENRILFQQLIDMYEARGVKFDGFKSSKDLTHPSPLNHASTPTGNLYSEEKNNSSDVSSDDTKIDDDQRSLNSEQSSTEAFNCQNSEYNPWRNENVDYNPARSVYTPDRPPVSRIADNDSSRDLNKLPKKLVNKLGSKSKSKTSFKKSSFFHR